MTEYGSPGIPTDGLATPPQEPASRAEPSGWQRTFASLGVPTYRWFWIGLLVHFLGFQMDMIARGYLAFDLTGSATALGIVSIAWGIPLLLFSLVGGTLADRVEKRNLLLAAQGAMALTAIITAILIQADLIQIWHMVVLGFFLGVIGAYR